MRARVVPRRPWLTAGAHRGAAMRLGAGDTADDQPHGEPPSSLGSGMAVLRFASKTKRKLARTAEAREKDGHNKQDSVSMETHLAIVQEQLDSVSKTLSSKNPADIHGIISAFTAARRLSQKHFASDETCETEGTDCLPLSLPLAPLALSVCHSHPAEL